MPSTEFGEAECSVDGVGGGCVKSYGLRPLGNCRVFGRENRVKEGDWLIDGVYARSKLAPAKDLRSNIE